MCTAVRLTDKNNNLYVGRNLDWGVPFGEKPLLVPADWTWQSRHIGAIATQSPIIGMGLLMKDMPLYFDAVNEAGLYCAGLSFAAGFAHYNDADPSKINVTSFEMPLWVCSEFTTVAQVKEAAQNLNITNDTFDPSLPTSDLHWFVADKDQSIVIEQTAEGLKIYDDGFDVLTNQPDFQFHCNNMRNYIHLDGDWTPERTMRNAHLTALGVGPSVMGLPGDPSAISRFVRVALLNASYPDQDDDADNITRLFKTLNAVSMVKGYCRQESGDFEYTIYTGGFDSATGTYHYTTYDDPAYHTFSFADAASLSAPANLK